MNGHEQKLRRRIQILKMDYELERSRSRQRELKVAQEALRDFLDEKDSRLEDHAKDEEKVKP